MTWAWVKASSQYLLACDTQRLSDTLEVRQPSTGRRWKQNPFCNLTAALPRFLVLDVWQRNPLVRVLKEILRLHLKWWLWRCWLLAYRSKHVVEATITTEGFAPRVYASIVLMSFAQTPNFVLSRRGKSCEGVPQPFINTQPLRAGAQRSGELITTRSTPSDRPAGIYKVWNNNTWQVPYKSHKNTLSSNAVA